MANDKYDALALAAFFAIVTILLIVIFSIACCTHRLKKPRLPRRSPSKKSSVPLVFVDHPPANSFHPLYDRSGSLLPTHRGADGGPGIAAPLKAVVVRPAGGGGDVTGDGWEEQSLRFKPQGERETAGERFARRYGSLREGRVEEVQDKVLGRDLPGTGKGEVAEERIGGGNEG
ncbi:hypothetical protein B0O99DRAFT_708304 [Bisporella sp. PMI_857]|nr:hypothetical protein B0O99DRAFT_708304 [Bisporella sp. PMI_857]